MANLTAEEYRLLYEAAPKHLVHEWIVGNPVNVVAATAGKKIVVTQLTLSTTTATTEIQIRDGASLLLGNLYVTGSAPVVLGNGEGVLFVTSAGNSLQIDPVGTSIGTVHITYKEVLV